MDDLLGGSSTIRTIDSVDIFDAMNDAANKHKYASDNNGKNYGSIAVTSTPPCAVISKVATNTPKMIIIFNQSADIKVGYFGNFELVYIQRDHRENFSDNPTIFPANPTKQDKTTPEKSIYALSELCMFDVFIHIIRIFMLVQIMLMI